VLMKRKSSHYRFLVIDTRGLKQRKELSSRHQGPYCSARIAYNGSLRAYKPLVSTTQHSLPVLVTSISAHRETTRVPPTTLPKYRGRFEASSPTYSQYSQMVLQPPAQLTRLRDKLRPAVSRPLESAKTPSETLAAVTLITWPQKYNPTACRLFDGSKGACIDLRVARSTHYYISSSDAGTCEGKLINKSLAIRLRSAHRRVRWVAMRKKLKAEELRSTIAVLAYHTVCNRSNASSRRNASTSNHQYWTTRLSYREYLSPVESDNDTAGSRARRNCKGTEVGIRFMTFLSFVKMETNVTVQYNSILLILCAHSTPIIVWSQLTIGLDVHLLVTKLT